MKDPWNSIKNMGKLLLLAAAVGILAGAIDALFGRVLLAVSAFRDDHISVLLPILPAAGLLIVLLYQTCSPLSQKGMTLVFEAGQNRRDAIPLPLIPLVMVGTWLTHLFGGSAGREGVAVQIGGCSRLCWRQAWPAKSPRCWVWENFPPFWAAARRSPTADSWQLLWCWVWYLVSPDGVFPPVCSKPNASPGNG